MNKLPDHTSLKEWASVIEALGRGEQIILIRKGGIADPHFGVEADRFYLYPTFFHQAEGTEPREVTITHWCEVVKTWRVSEQETLYRLEPHVVMPRETLDARYRFRPDQALYIIAVRTFALARPVTIAQKAEYVGCRSWVSVDDEIDVEGSTPALGEAELSGLVAGIDALLA
jgi:hypothetical protein